jgi:hypothetical protein
VFGSSAIAGAGVVSSPATAAGLDFSYAGHRDRDDRDDGDGRAVAM